jgi:hypothetical protein
MEMTMKLVSKITLMMVVFIIGTHAMQIREGSKGTTNTFTKVDAPPLYLYRTELNRFPTAKFGVKFSDNFPANVKPAFLHATEIWSYLIVSSESIHVTARWEVLDQNTLASTGSDSLFKNFPNAPKADMYYPVSLAEAISHQNLNGTKPEMTITVNSSLSDWYNETDGNVPAGKYDMVTLILHELAHGLGFDHSFNVSGSNGSWGTWGGAYTGYKVGMDDWCISGLNHGSNIYKLTTTITYPNPSVELGNALKSSNIYFDGSNVYRMAGSVLAKLWTPNSWSTGSSIAHLNDTIYPAGSANSLMTHAQDPAEATHSPGELGMAILQDLGWTINRCITPTFPTAGNVWQKNTNDTVEWTDNQFGGGTLDIEVWKRAIDGTYSRYSILGSSPSVQGQNKSFIWNANVDTGIYRFKFLNNALGEQYGYSNAFAILEQGSTDPVFPPGTPYIVVTNITPREISAGQSTVTTTISYTNQFKWTVPSCTPEQLSIVAIKIDQNTYINYNYSATKGSYTVSFTLGAGPHTLSFVQREIENGKCVEVGQAVIPKTTATLTWNFDITYGPAQVTLEQKTQEGNRVGTIGVWNGSSFNPRYTPSTTLPFAWHSTQFIHADTNLFSSQKYNNWSKARDNFISMPDVINRHSFYIDTNIIDTYQSNLKPTADATIQTQVDGIAAGNVYFQDPWLIDSVDQSHGNARMNRGKDNTLFRLVPYAINNLGASTNYKGVILNQNPQFNPLVPTYSVKAQSPSDYTSTFLGWSVTNGQADFQNANAQSTDVVFRQANTTVTAKYKASLASNTIVAIANTSQKKFTRTKYNNVNNAAIHAVYESMGYIWWERSTDNGVTWQLMNNNQPVSIYGATTPSIASVTGSSPEDYIAITYAVPNSSWLLGIKLNVYAVIGNTIVNVGSQSINDPYPLPGLNTPPPFALNPVVSINTGDRILVVWEGDGANPLGNQKNALWYWYGSIIKNINGNATGFSKINNGVISGTTDYSYFPTMDATYGSYFHLAWKEGTNTINYKRIIGDANSISEETTYPISDGSGYTKNKKPSIVSIGNTARVSWVGFQALDERGLAKTSAEEGDYQTVFTATDNLYSFWSFGSNVTSTSINSNRTSSYSPISEYAVAWSIDNGATNEYTRNSSLGGEIIPFSTDGQALNGLDLALVPGTSFANMFGAVLNTQQSPYRLKLSDNIGVLGKTNTSQPIFNGRQGIVWSGNAQFYFMLGDISVDGKNISFIEKPDSIVIENKEILNKYLTTEPFAISDETQFYYSIRYNIIDSSAVSELLDQQGDVSFKVQLIDEVSNTIIGEYDKVVFNKANQFQYKCIGYQVDTKGIGQKVVRLRLIANSNLDVQYSIVQRHASEQVVNLGKGNIRRQQIGYKGELVVTDYSLSQNFPNPFNPSTTINYALPKAGNVMLKVYDILGKEVATLVNNYKESGRYSVEFDASKFSSGMYIYKLTSDKFTEVKKMMLVK